MTEAEVRMHRADKKHTRRNMQAKDKNKKKIDTTKNLVKRQDYESSAKDDRLKANEG